LSPFRFRPTLFCRGGVATEMIIPIRLAEKRIYRDCRTGALFDSDDRILSSRPTENISAPPTRIRRDRNPSLGFMAHGPEIKFARDRFSKLLHICGVSHSALLLWNAYSISAVALRWRLNAAPRRYFNVTIRSIAARLRFPTALPCSRKRLFRCHALAFGTNQGLPPRRAI